MSLSARVGSAQLSRRLEHRVLCLTHAPATQATTVSVTVTWDTFCEAVLSFPWSPFPISMFFMAIVEKQAERQGQERKEVESIPHLNVLGSFQPRLSFDARISELINFFINRKVNVGWFYVKQEAWIYRLSKIWFVSLRGFISERRDEHRKRFISSGIQIDIESVVQIAIVSALPL